jgi:hypothetical protein
VGAFSLSARKGQVVSDPHSIEIDDTTPCCVCGKTFLDEELLNWRQLTNHETGEQRLWVWHDRCGPFDMYLEINN